MTDDTLYTVGIDFGIDFGIGKDYSVTTVVVPDGFFAGIPIVIDETLAPNEVVFVADDMRVVFNFVDGEFVRGEAGGVDMTPELFERLLRAVPAEYKYRRPERDK